MSEENKMAEGLVALVVLISLFNVIAYGIVQLLKRWGIETPASDWLGLVIGIASFALAFVIVFEQFLLLELIRTDR